jgi:hypothetical protein
MKHLKTQNNSLKEGVGFYYFNLFIYKRKQ